METVKFDAYIVSLADDDRFGVSLWLDYPGEDLPVMVLETEHWGRQECFNAITTTLADFNISKSEWKGKIHFG